MRCDFCSKKIEGTVMIKPGPSGRTFFCVSCLGETLKEKYMQQMKCRGYKGSIEYDEKDECFRGKIEGIKSIISYEGCTEQEVYEAFTSAVDYYIEENKEEIER